MQNHDILYIPAVTGGDSHRPLSEPRSTDNYSLYNVPSVPINRPNKKNQLTFTTNHDGER